MSHTTRYFSLLFLLFGLCSISLAEYKHIQPIRDEESLSNLKPSEKIANNAPPGGRLEVRALASGRTNVLSNRNGAFAIQHVNALESVRFRLAKPDVPSGAKIYVFTINGGRVNGKLADTITVKPGGEFDVVFTAGPYGGNYPVVVRYGGSDEVLEFWVGEKPGDALRASKVAGKDQP